MNPQRRKLYWRICCILATVLMILAFTPVFLPPQDTGPFLFGLPYTLWAGILLCLMMVVLTYLATLVHPGREEEWDDVQPHS